MNIVTIVGARPQFIKVAAVSRAFRRFNELKVEIAINEVIVHTGQHYDRNMSKVFFEELDIPEPHYNLGISAVSHGAMTGRMLEKIEEILMQEKTDMVLIYGDTNSTLAGALAAAKLHIPVAHVEAGLRSFNMKMPEEVNRIVADKLSSLLLCPTDAAVANLAAEGIEAGVHNVGDVMYDAAIYYGKKAKESVSLSKWGVSEGRYGLCTVHRAENTDDPERLAGIFNALEEIAETLPLLLPLHPRTMKVLSERGMLGKLKNLILVDPVSYLEMIRLEMSASLIITDSGGVQKEAFFHKVPCLTLRDETEWVETVELGFNRLCSANHTKIVEAWREMAVVNETVTEPYGKGDAADKIVKIIRGHFASC